MGNMWGRYSKKTVLQFPQSDLCECGHHRKDHHRRSNGASGFCYLCPDPNKPIEMGQPPTDDVFGLLVGEQEKCEKFHKWSVERVRRFWNVANIMLSLKTNREQTILDDFHPVFDKYGYQMGTKYGSTEPSYRNL